MDSSNKCLIETEFNPFLDVKFIFIGIDEGVEINEQKLYCDNMYSHKSIKRYNTYEHIYHKFLYGIQPRNS